MKSICFLILIRLRISSCVGRASPLTDRSVSLAKTLNCHLAHPSRAPSSSSRCRARSHRPRPCSRWRVCHDDFAVATLIENLCQPAAKAIRVLPVLAVPVSVTKSTSGSVSRFIAKFCSRLVRQYAPQCMLGVAVVFERFEYSGLRPNFSDACIQRRFARLQKYTNWLISVLHDGAL